MEIHRSNNKVYVAFTILIIFQCAKGLFLDPLQDSPNIYQSNPSSNCLSVIKNGELKITQDLGVFTRKTSLVMSDSENFDMLGHELCIASGYLVKSSGPVGMSYFEIEYEYMPAVLINTALEPILFKMRIDLPQYVSLYLTIYVTDSNDSTVAINEIYNLGEFMEPFTDYTLAIFNRLNGTYLVNRFKYNILPADNNIDLRISYPKQARTNYLQYRTVISNPPNARCIFALDGNINTTFRVMENQQANLTINFPAILFKRSITLIWKAPPTDVKLGYLNSTGQYQHIQNWSNQRPIMRVAKRNNPVAPINNLHLIITGFAVLSEVEYI